MSRLSLTLCKIAPYKGTYTDGEKLISQLVAESLGLYATHFPHFMPINTQRSTAPVMYGEETVKLQFRSPELSDIMYPKVVRTVPSMCAMAYLDNILLAMNDGAQLNYRVVLGAQLMLADIIRYNNNITTQDGKRPRVFLAPTIKDPHRRRSAQKAVSKHLIEDDTKSINKKKFPIIPAHGKSVFETIGATIRTYNATDTTESVSLAIGFYDRDVVLSPIRLAHAHKIVTLDRDRIESMYVHNIQKTATKRLGLTNKPSIYNNAIKYQGHFGNIHCVMDNEVAKLIIVNTVNTECRCTRSCTDECKVEDGHNNPNNVMARHVYRHTNINSCIGNAIIIVPPATARIPLPALHYLKKRNKESLIGSAGYLIGRIVPAELLDLSFLLPKEGTPENAKELHALLETVCTSPSTPYAGIVIASGLYGSNMDELISEIECMKNVMDADNYADLIDLLMNFKVSIPVTDSMMLHIPSVSVSHVPQKPDSTTASEYENQALTTADKVSVGLAAYSVASIAFNTSDTLRIAKNLCDQHINAWMKSNCDKDLMLDRVLLAILKVCNNYARMGKTPMLNILTSVFEDTYAPFEDVKNMVAYVLESYYLLTKNNTIPEVRLDVVLRGVLMYGLFSMVLDMAQLRDTCERSGAYDPTNAFLSVLRAY